ECKRRRTRQGSAVLRCKMNCYRRKSGAGSIADNHTRKAGAKRHENVLEMASRLVRMWNGSKPGILLFCHVLFIAIGLKNASLKLSRVYLAHPRWVRLLSFSI